MKPGVRTIDGCAVPGVGSGVRLGNCSFEQKYTNEFWEKRGDVGRKEKVKNRIIEKKMR